MAEGGGSIINIGSGWSLKAEKMRFLIVLQKVVFGISRGLWR